MKSTLFFGVLAAMSGFAAAAPAPVPGALEPRWRWSTWADADSSEEGVMAKPGAASKLAAAKRWAWTKWEDATEDTEASPVSEAKAAAKRWAWTKWEDATEDTKEDVAA
ncbi:hypothetical protein PG988_010994 [Apiospora saccharicola]